MKHEHIGCHVVSLIALYPSEYEVRVNLGLTTTEDIILSKSTKDLVKALHWFEILTLLMKKLDEDIEESL